MISYREIGRPDENGMAMHTNWKGNMDGCSGRYRYTGDVDGDGKDDIICKDETAGLSYYIFSGLIPTIILKLCI